MSASPPPEEWTVTYLEEETERFMKDINRALNVACPLRRKPVRIPSIPWWTKELAHLKRTAEMVEKSI